MAETKGIIRTESLDSSPGFDRVPPQAIEAEMAVLGSILIDNDSLSKVIEILDTRCFYRTAHQKIYATVLKLYEKDEPVDLVTLSEALKKEKILDEVGGPYYLTELAECVPSAANVEYHARIVLEKYLLRKMIEETSAIAKECYDGTENAFYILDHAEQRIFNLSDTRLRKGFVHIDPILHETFEFIEQYHRRQGTVIGIPSGFTKLDELMSGFQKSELIVVAGRPSMGKTAFCLNITRHVAVEEKIPVGFFSLEMSRRQLAMRLLCAEARVDAHGVRTGRLAPDEWQKLSM